MRIEWNEMDSMKSEREIEKSNERNVRTTHKRNYTKNVKQVLSKAKTKMTWIY